MERVVTARAGRVSYDRRPVLPSWGRNCDRVLVIVPSLSLTTPRITAGFLRARTSTRKADIYSFIQTQRDTNQSTLFAWNFSGCTSYHEQDIRWLSVALEICKQISFPTMPSRRRQSARRTEVLS